MPSLEPLDYELPPHLIAQEPAADRDSSRLLLVNRSTRTLSHHRFHELPSLLDPGHLLILNDTRVVPARLVGKREKTGGKWEALFLLERPDGLWELLAQMRGHPRIGESVAIEPGPLRLILRGRSGGHWLAEPSPGGNAVDLLATSGRVPLPPYIRKGIANVADLERYQTVFARINGSVAAPTAGLHFTTALLERLGSRGIELAYVTLHVGLGTFEPIRTADAAQHQMHAEWADVPVSTVDAIRACKARGRRVIAVGTTASRALESAARRG